MDDWMSFSRPKMITAAEMRARNNRRPGDGPPPHNKEAERAVLGAILLDSRALAEAKAAGLVCSDFFVPANRTLFFRMELMVEEGKGMDLVTLADELERAGDLEKAGGAAYLASLLDGMPRVSNTKHYAKIVRDHSRRRDLIRDAHIVFAAACEVGSDPDFLRSRGIDLLTSGQAFARAPGDDLAVSTGAQEATETTEGGAEWIARPIAALGAITEICGKVKQAGKTTFVTHLAAAVLDAKPFLGQPTRKSPVVYLTEQPPATFRLAMRRAGLLGREDFHIVYWNRAAGMAWEVLAQRAIKLCQRVGAKLLVVDTLAQFAGITGDSENNSGDALRAMQPLQRGAAAGLGIIVVRHERKSGGAVGDSGRGSSAYAGAVDIVISVRLAEGGGDRNFRLIQAVSRFDEAPDNWVIEYDSASGYRLRGTAADLSRERARQVLLDAAPRSEAEAMPAAGLCEAAGISRAKFYRLLGPLLTEGLIHRTGTGQPGDQYLYWRGESLSHPL
ncbi:MAG TPA: DnaB-like helicase N-terminal domain-containing protein [Candidatus Acidoferrales bacterium]|nr:DnaB-like helicase N-terminal domain-containing protein [Candidatus Acidoferrales bacterium]